MSGVVVGVNLPQGVSGPEGIRKTLKSFVEDGFDCVEFYLDTIPLIIGGELEKRWALYLKDLLAEFPLVYSGHIGRGIDLRNVSNHELHKKAMFASVEAAEFLGLKNLNLHYEEEGKNHEIEERFLEGHIEVADYAAKLGVNLTIENIEVEHVAPVLELVKKVDRKNFKLNLDVGHAFLAANYYKFDFIDAVKEAAPYLGHIHLNDNTGGFEELRMTNRPAYDSLPMGYRIALGRGDIHLPPYWGKIPFDEVFNIIGDYSGIYMCEYYSQRYTPFNKTIQENVRKAILKSK